jgi:hypothetical protein
MYFPIKIFNDDYERQYFDNCTFNEVIAIAGKNTWQVMNAKKALKIEWEPFEDQTIKRKNLRGVTDNLIIPAGLESTGNA